LDQPCKKPYFFSGFCLAINPDCGFLSYPDQAVVERLDGIIFDKLNRLPAAVETAKVNER